MSKLFTPGEDWENNCCLNFTKEEGKWDLYAEGFKRSAEIQIDHIQTIRIDQDSLIYPIVFNYRQYIELRLKQIMLLAGMALVTHHDMTATWIEVRKIIENKWPTTPKKTLDEIEVLIKEFSIADQRSMSFRYPVDKNNNPHLEEISLINVTVLKSHIDKIADMLDGVSYILGK